MIMRRVGKLLAFFLILPAVLLAQNGVVRGRITDAARAPLARAIVSAEGSGLHATSDDQGRYEIRGLSSGAYLLRVRLLGYQPRTARVVVDQAAVTQDFVLTEQPISLSPVDVVVGSRARHTAAEQLAVPVDVFTAEQLAQQGTTETGQILQSLAPSVNFPHQSVTDATDIVRPFTLRGLSPDETLVLINGWRRHQMALVNTFAYGTGAGSSGVDLNAIPSSAIDRIDVLRDGASAQYGSDAIAGVVNMVLKEGPFTPFLNTSIGRYHPNDYPDDGTTANLNGGWGIGIGRGSLGSFGEFLDRQPTNRAWADPFEDAGTGVTDSIVDGRVIIKRNPVAQPNHHWGDGLEKDIITMANFRLPLNDRGTTELYSFGGWSYRKGTGNGYRRCAVDCASFINGRSWPQIYPLGYLPEFAPNVSDYSAAGGIRTVTNGWSVELGTAYGYNRFDYHLRHTLNVSLGPCLDPKNPCAPGPDSTLGTADDMANQTSFYAGRLRRGEWTTGINAAKAMTLGLSAPVNVAVGASFRREDYQIMRGELASYVDGNHLGPDSSAGSDRPYSQVFPGFRPADESKSNRTNAAAYADLETNLTPSFLANVAGRFEHYSDFGSLFTGTVAFQSRQHQRHRRCRDRRAHRPRRRQRGSPVQLQAVASGEIRQLERGVCVQSERQRHLHGRRIPDSDRPPDSAQRDVQRQRDSSDPRVEWLHQCERPAVFHEWPEHAHARSRCDGVAADGGWPGEHRLVRGGELHEQQDPARRSAARCFQRHTLNRDQPHRLGDLHRHHGGAARLARYAHG